MNFEWVIFLQSIYHQESMYVAIIRPATNAVEVWVCSMSPELLMKKTFQCIVNDPEIKTKWVVGQTSLFF